MSAAHIATPIAGCIHFLAQRSAPAVTPVYAVTTYVDHGRRILLHCSRRPLLPPLPLPE